MSSYLIRYLRKTGCDMRPTILGLILYQYDSLFKVLCFLIVVFIIALDRFPGNGAKFLCCRVYLSTDQMDEYS